MRFWTVFSRWVGSGGPPLGGDLPPTGPPSPQDNLLVGDKSLTYRDTGQTHRVAVAYSGSAQITADLWIYEEATDAWYKVSAAPVVLPPNAITFFDVAVALSTAGRLQGDATQPGGELQAVLVPHDPGSLDPGEFKFAMAPNLSEPSSSSGGGSSGNVSIVSPIPLPVTFPTPLPVSFPPLPSPLPVTFSSPPTIWSPSTIGALSNSGSFKGSSGLFHQIIGFSTQSDKRYIMLFDSASVPANGTPSWACLNVPANANFSIDLPRPRTFHDGLSWAVSTTANVLTLDVLGQFWVQSEVE